MVRVLLSVQFDGDFLVANLLDEPLQKGDAQGVCFVLSVKLGDVTGAVGDPGTQRANVGCRGVDVGGTDTLEFVAQGQSVGGPANALTCFCTFLVSMVSNQVAEKEAVGVFLELAKQPGQFDGKVKLVRAGGVVKSLECFAGLGGRRHRKSNRRGGRG